MDRSHYWCASGLKHVALRIGLTPVSFSQNLGAVPHSHRPGSSGVTIRYEDAWTLSVILPGLCGQPPQFPGCSKSNPLQNKTSRERAKTWRVVLAERWFPGQNRGEVEGKPDAVISGFTRVLLSDVPLATKDLHTGGWACNVASRLYDDRHGGEVAVRNPAQRSFVGANHCRTRGWLQQGYA